MFATTFHALRKKLCCRVSALFLPVALLVMAFAAYFYQTEKEKEIATNSVNERAVVALGKASISSVLEDIGIDLLFIAQHSALKNLLERSTPESVKYFSQDMLYFSEKHAIYDQIRWIDETGLERVRVNFNDGHPSITPKGNCKARRTVTTLPIHSSWIPARSMFHR